MAIVLKQSQSGAPAGHVGLANFNLSDLAEAGKRQLTTARAEAEQIMQAAEREANNVRQQAAEAGRKAGLADAEREIEERVQRGLSEALESRIPLLEKAVQRIAEAESAWLEQWNANVLQAAVGLAEQLVRAELRQNTDALARWITEAIDLARAAKNITVRLHPDSLARCGEFLDQLATQSRTAVRFEVDSGIERDGVVITTEGGEIDLQLQSQLDRLRQQLGLLDNDGRDERAP